MPVYFIQPLELRQLLIRLVLSLQPRVGEKELIVHPWIFCIELRTARRGPMKIPIAAERDWP